MKKKPIQLTAAMQKTSVSDAVKMAAANFVLINITLGFWDGTAALGQAAKKAAIDAGVSETDVRMYANILGKFGHARLREVNKHFRLARTYIDGATTPYAPDADAGKQKRGDKMLGAMRYPEVVAAVATLNTNAFANLEDFLTGYEGYRERALSANLGDWAAEAEKRFPTVDDVAAPVALLSPESSSSSSCCISSQPRILASSLPSASTSQSSFASLISTPARFVWA